ncbi:MAG TPA: hypothetical protein H9909_07245 [Candidatus Mediterraneibacter norfolkensis]|nr:hypothetical protein [Candidatus Mediterraneibacter norfolkensis]
MSEIKTRLSDAAKKYDEIIVSKQFNAAVWLEKANLISPVTAELRAYAQQKIAECERERFEKNRENNKLIITRAELYNNLSEEKRELSKLDETRIKIAQEISTLSTEIGELEKKIADLQNKIAKSKEDKEYWDTVFWATCWIPFVNIGTGVKKGHEEGEYRAQVKVYGRDCQIKQDRIEKLKVQLEEISTRQKENEESLSKMANQIVVTEEKISEVTDTLNKLRHEIGLWNNIYSSCLEIETELRYINGSIEKVRECFCRLTEVRDLIEASQNSFVS